MNVSIAGLIVQADAAMSGLGHAPSTHMQYRWAWSQFERFFSREGVDEFTEDIVALYLQAVAAEHREGRIKEWKHKLLRKSVLVLSEVARTGAYQWGLSRRIHPNDALSAAFRQVQEQFEAWLGNQGLALATRNLYSVVSRTVLAWLPERGVADVRELSGADVSAAVVFLGGHYRPGSMRTAVTAVRVLCRFLEDSGYCAGLTRAVPTRFSRRVNSAVVLAPDRIEGLTNSPDVSKPSAAGTGPCCCWRPERACALLTWWVCV